MSGPVVAVAGMHRSGTSLVSRFLHDSGINLGERLHVDLRTNPYGHYEDEEFLEFQRNELARAFDGEDYRVAGDFEPSPGFVAKARELVRLIKKYQLPAKVNLIPFNPWPGANYECSTPERIKSFSSIVFGAGISAPVRTPRGRDIDAACGQLKTASEKKSRAELDALADEKQAALG